MIDSDKMLKVYGCLSRSEPVTSRQISQILDLDIRITMYCLSVLRRKGEALQERRWWRGRRVNLWKRR
jgi:hypothetical protein